MQALVRYSWNKRHIRRQDMKSNRASSQAQTKATVGHVMVGKEAVDIHLLIRTHVAGPGAADSHCSTMGHYVPTPMDGTVRWTSPMQSEMFLWSVMVINPTGLDAAA